jgi:hypothetical protein
MKHTRYLTNGLIACALTIAMVSTVAAQTANDGAAKVVRIKGPARYMVGNTAWQPLKVGAVLKPGTIVQTSTEPGSFVDIVLGDGNAAVPTAVDYKPYIPSSLSSGGAAYQPSAEQNVVRIWENTALGIDKLTTMQTGAEQVTDTQLDLKAGRISGNVKKMSAASKYEIKLPNGVAGIRGTVYDVTSDGVVRVLVGSVVVAWVDSKTGNVDTHVVMGGQQFDARSGQTTPIAEGDMPAFDKLIASMRVAGGPASPTTGTTYVPDRTAGFVSPNGPPFQPPGPPPTIPPGRGRGRGPGG